MKIKSKLLAILCASIVSTGLHAINGYVTTISSDGDTLYAPVARPGNIMEEAARELSAGVKYFDQVRDIGGELQDCIREYKWPNSRQQEKLANIRSDMSQDEKDNLDSLTKAAFINGNIVEFIKLACDYTLQGMTNRAIATDSTITEQLKQVSADIKRGHGTYFPTPTMSIVVRHPVTVAPTVRVDTRIGSF